MGYTVARFQWVDSMQQAVGVGANNVFVQIEGDGNKVVLGNAHLTLTRHLQFISSISGSELEMLIPYSRTLPLIGRETQLSALWDFLRCSAPISARVVTGGAGTGKTRLALHLCDEASNLGWHAGFIRGDELKRFIAQQNLAEWGWSKPTLGVVDYAATSAKELATWFAELANNAGIPGRPLRLLLLERHADVNSGWWQSVFNTGSWESVGVRKLLAPEQPVHLEPLSHDARPQLFNGMLNHIGPSPDDQYSTAFTRCVDANLSSGDPLFLMMAALGLASAHSPETFRNTDLALTLAEREIGRLGQLASAVQLDPPLVQHLAACVTLVQGTGRTSFRAFADLEKVSIGRASGGDSARLTDCLHQAFPTTDGGIAPVLPDLIGEAVILRVLESLGSESDEVVQRCFNHFGLSAAVTIIHACQDFYNDSTPRRWLRLILEQVRSDLNRLRELADQFPEESVVLSELAAETYEALVEQLLRLLIADNRSKNAAPLLHELAASFHNLAHFRSSIGHRQAALHAAENAAEYYRVLEALDRDFFLADRARSLNTVGACLNSLGKYEAALEFFEGAVSIQRKLAEEKSPKLRSGLAGYLCNLAISLRDLGRLEQALSVSEEATSLRRELLKETDTPDEDRSRLAVALHTLSGTLAALDRRTSAMDAAEEAVAHYRELARYRPDAFLPSLGTMLSTLSDRLADCGFYDLAIQHGQEAVSVQRRLAEQRPGAFLRDLASALNSLANRHSELGQYDLALKMSQEAISIFKQLTCQNSEMYLPDLALASANLANRLADVGQPEAAIQSSRDSVRWYRDLVQQQPDAFLPKLAST